MEHNAFIIYFPIRKAGKPRLFFNSEVLGILESSGSNGLPSNGDSLDLFSLSARWKGLLDSRLNGGNHPGEGLPSEEEVLEVFQSQRRRYAVKGIPIPEHFGTGSKKRRGIGGYLFILERILPDRMNLAMVFRQYHLSPREQEVVRFLLDGLSNKEIAEALGLSLNTVKGYLKLLTRKMGAGSRMGILSCLLSGARESSLKKLSLS
jgi:DNA-binding CsgD family transcriptional regulator